MQSRPLSLHNAFQVPLEGTAVTLGILGAATGAGCVWLLGLLGLDFSPLPPVLTSFLPRLDPGGMVFTVWRWSPPVHWAGTAAIEILLWSLIGTAIARTVVSRVVENEPMGVRTALAFAASHFTKSIAFVSLTVGGFVALSVPMLLPTLLGLIPGAGPALGTGAYLILAPVLFLLALLGVAVILAGMPIGYLFLPPALAMRDGTLLDATARAVGYAFARPFLFIWDVFKMAVFAVCIHHIGTHILPDVVRGMPTLFGLLPAGSHPAQLSETAQSFQHLVLILVRILAGGFVVAYVFGASTLIYLNLRLEVDGLAIGESAQQDAPAEDAAEDA